MEQLHSEACKFNDRNPIRKAALKKRACRLAYALVFLASVTALSKDYAMAAQDTPPSKPQGQLPPPRPGHFAELEELNAARRLGTRAAYDLFLARHPGSRYAEEARRERSALAR